MPYGSPELNRFNAIVSEIDAVYHIAAQRTGVSDSVQHILYVLCSEGEGLTQADICRVGCMSKQTIHSAIRTMVRDGLLTLTGSHHKRIHLTDAGRSLMERVARPVVAAENAVLSEWTAQERELYLSLTHRYARALRERIDHIFPEETK